MSNIDWTSSLQNGESLYQGVLAEVMYEMIDDLTLGLSFEVHRACKLRTLLLADTDEVAQKQFEIVDKPGFDVFGQAPTKKQFECVCPNCQRTLAASRFAPHLEKCMGMGRNSSRIASRRIANVTVKRDSDESGGEEENDNDWNYSQDRKVKKIKKERSTNSPRRNTKSVRLRNGNSNAHNNSINNNNNNNGSNHHNNNHSSTVISTMATTTTTVTTVNSSTTNNNNNSTTDNQNNGNSEPVNSIYETMTLEERKALLLHTCGVISEHTKKMCTRSIRCPQHTDEQRFKLRQYILNQGEPNTESDDIHIDIDTYEDGDSQSLRETLQWEASSNSSPADSTSTNNSTTSSKKRGNKSTSKTKCKKQKISRTGSSGNINESSVGNTNAGTFDFV